MFYEDTSQTALDCLERRVAELTAALKEARAMLRACGLEEPDDLPTLWTNSYFVATVGGAPLQIVKQYIKNQKNV